MDKLIVKQIDSKMLASLGFKRFRWKRRGFVIDYADSELPVNVPREPLLSLVLPQQGLAHWVFPP